MEQKDSLKSELQNLTRLQGEQINILRDMSGKQTEQATLSQANQAHQQANFNTPGMYQNSAPMYGNPFGTTPMNSPYGNPYGTNYSNMFKAMGGQKFGMLDVLSPNSQMSLTSRTLTSMDQGSKFAQAGLAAGGAALASGASWGLGAMLPGVAGIGAGILGGVAAGAYVDMTAQEVKKNSALKKYLYKNSSMFIDPFETENDRGVAGFSREQSEDAANFVRTMNDEFYMGDDDTMMLLQKFTEGGLLKESKDLDTFKDKMKTLTKTVKEGALMLNETYDSIADLMAEMRAAGIDQKSFKDIMGSGATLGSLFGEDGSDVVRDFLDYVKNLNSGTGNDNKKTFDRLENTGIYMGKWYDELKNSDKDKLSFTDSQNLNMIDNLGGPDGASKYTLSLMEKMVEKDQFKNTGMYFYDYNKEKGEFQFNDKSFNEFINNDISLQEMYKSTSDKKNELTKSGNGNAVTLWDNQFASYYKDSLEDGNMSDFVGKILGAYTNDPQLKSQGYDYRGILNMMGVSDAGNQNLLTGFLTYKDDNPKLAQQVKLQNIWQQQTAGKIAEAPTLTEQVKSGWEKVKDNLTQGFVDFDNTMGKAMQGIQDWWTGYKPAAKYDSTFTTSSKIESISYDEVNKNTKQTNDILASGFSSLKEIQEKGYTVDQELYKFMEKKYSVADKTVEYDRDIITNWDELSQGIKESKDEISKIAEKNDLSETIVAALFKYNQQKPGDEQLKITTTNDSFAQNLGNQLFQYGGNNQLALAAALDSGSSVDNALSKLGYNAQNLRSVGAQENLANISIDGLGLNEDIVNQVKEIISQSLRGGIDGGGSAVIPETKEQVKSQDLSNKSNVTAEDLDKIIEKNTANKPGSIMKGMGETIIQASSETNLDPMYLLAHAGWETGWGTSGILNDKYNWFGIGAYNSSPSESAYKFGDKSGGFIEGAKWIKENYYDEGQSTISGMIGVPGHNYAVNDDGSPNTSWESGISSVIVDGLQYVGKGYGETEGTNSSTPGNVTTKKESISKDQYGNKISEEQVYKNNQERWAKEGFSNQSNSESYLKMENFLSKTDTLQFLKSETSEDKSNRINDTILNYSKDGKLEKDVLIGSFGISPTSINEGELAKLTSKLTELIDKSLDSDSYGGVSDILSKDKDAQKIIEKITSYFKDSDDGQEFVNKIIDEKKITSIGASDGLSRYEMMQEFGQQLLGINKEKLMEDSSGYNVALDNGVSSFYDSGLSMLKGFLGGNKDSAEYQSWEGKSASEQEALLETLKKIEYALGVDGDKSEVDKAMEGKSRDDIHNEEDNYKKNFIQKDKQGKYYYDESKGENSEATWDDYNKWVNQGERRLNFGSISKLLDSEKIQSTNEEGSSVSIEDLVQRVTENMNKASEEQYNLIHKEGESYLNTLMEKKEEIIGMSSSEKEDMQNAVNSGDQDAINAATNNYNKFLEQIGQMIKSGDSEGLKAFKEDEKAKGSDGRTINDGEFDKFIELAEKIKSMDASEFMKIVEGLNEIIAQSSDVAKTAALFTGADGKTEGGLGEDFSQKFSDTLKESIEYAFEGTDFGSKVTDGDYDVAKILEIIQNGGVENGEVVLSPDSLDKMALVMSDAMDRTFDEQLKTTGGIQEFEESALYDMFKDGITIDMNGQEIKLDEAMQMLTEVAAQGSEATSEAMSKRDEVLTLVKTAFEEQVDEAGDVTKDAQSKLDEANGNTSKTVDEFVTTIQEYDGAIQSAIKTLGSSVTTINSSVDDVDSKVQKHLDWHNSAFNPANWFGGNSNGDSVDTQ